jgi:hypothetical protein
MTLAFRFVSFVLAAAALVALAACSRTRDAAPGAGGVASLWIEGADNRGVSIAAEGDRVVVVWAATTENLTNIYAGVSRDGGKTFDAPVRVNDVEGDARATGEQPPKVAIGRDVVVAWESKASDGARIRLARSADGGRTFRPATTVHQPGLTGVRGWASLVLDGNGDAHVAWLDGRHAHPTGPTTPKPAADLPHLRHPPRMPDTRECTRPCGRMSLRPSSVPMARRPKRKWPRTCASAARPAWRSDPTARRTWPFAASF